ncbi:MAG: radical SAM protein [Treponema sp.]|nr:radical SAM protein [Treponema sp.]
MNADDKSYKNQLEENLAFYDLYLNDYIKRLEFCRDNGCNTLMLTGNTEPQQNRRFLVDFGIMMRLMERPFRNIEIQTTGVLIDNPMLRFLRNHVGVNTIALSLFSFDNEENQECRGSALKLDITEFCKQVKLYDFNLRLCINMTKYFQGIEVFEVAKEFGADQVTLRKLYDAGDGSPQSKWVKENRLGQSDYTQMAYWLTGMPILRKLEYGQAAQSVMGMSVVLDNDCMAKDNSDDFKYLIIRPNGKLYSSWDDPASLIF